MLSSSMKQATFLHGLKLLWHFTVRKGTKIASAVSTSINMGVRLRLCPVHT